MSGLETASTIQIRVGEDSSNAYDGHAAATAPLCEALESLRAMALLSGLDRNLLGHESGGSEGVTLKLNGYEVARAPHSNRDLSALETIQERLGPGDDGSALLESVRRLAERQIGDWSVSLRNMAREVKRAATETRGISEALIELDLHHKDFAAGSLEERLADRAGGNGMRDKIGDGDSDEDEGEPTTASEPGSGSGSGLGSGSGSESEVEAESEEEESMDGSMEEADGEEDLLGKDLSEEMARMLYGSDKGESDDEEDAPIRAADFFRPPKELRERRRDTQGFATNPSSHNTHQSSGNPNYTPINKRLPTPK